MSDQAIGPNTKVVDIWKVNDASLAPWVCVCWSKPLSCPAPRKELSGRNEGFSGIWLCLKPQVVSQQAHSMQLCTHTTNNPPLIRFWSNAR